MKHALIADGHPIAPEVARRVIVLGIASVSFLAAIMHPRRGNGRNTKHSLRPLTSD